MTILYDILTPDDLSGFSPDKKIEFIHEIIVTGKYCYFEKFKNILPEEVSSLIPAETMLELLPINIDDKLFEYILNNYEFKNGQHFFYNFAMHSESMRIKELVYDYFVENFSHIIFDNIDMYEALIEK